MNYFEKLGLLVLIFVFSYDFPLNWKGVEVFIFLVGGNFFIWGKKIEDFLDLITPD